MTSAGGVVNDDEGGLGRRADGCVRRMRAAPRFRCEAGGR